MAEDCAACSAEQAGGCGKKGPGALLKDQLIASTLKQIRHKVFVLSGKGGVGKSSIAVNIAVALALKGRRVGLLDVDLHGPSVPNLLGLKGGLDADRGRLIKPKRYGDNLFVVSMDSLLACQDQAIVWRGPMKHAAIRQFLGDVAWGALDFLIIDSPPGTGDEHLTILKAIPEAQCLLVTTPQEISLADVRKSVHFLRQSQASILGVVENMSGLVCPGCGEMIPLFKQGGGREMAAQYGLAFLAAVPLDPSAVVAGDMGIPVVLLESDAPAKIAMLELADRIAEKMERGGEGVEHAD